MTNLPRSAPAGAFRALHSLRAAVLKKQQSAEDGTIKFLWELQDGNAVETVVHAVSLREYGLHLLAGRLPAGMRVLRFDHRRSCAESHAVGNA